jgi:DMSO/TMAO reductase YedYZ molybdopterin-dependent catalytic subunit
VPSSSARGIDQLGALQLLSVPAIGGPGGPSTGIVLTGDSVTSPGTYSVSDLQTEFTPVNVVANGNEYIGIPLWSFLDPNTTDIMDKLVVVKGTDGYQVVHALAELDPSKGGDPFILLAYDDTGGDLNPGNADCCRTILPGDTVRRGRWMSNLYEIAVIDAPTATPLPASWTMMLLGLAGLGATKLRRAKKSLVTIERV